MADQGEPQSHASGLEAAAKDGARLLRDWEALQHKDSKGTVAEDAVRHFFSKKRALQESLLCIITQADKHRNQLIWQGKTTMPAFSVHAEFVQRCGAQNVHDVLRAADLYKAIDLDEAARPHAAWICRAIDALQEQIVQMEGELQVMQGGVRVEGSRRDARASVAELHRLKIQWHTWHSDMLELILRELQKCGLSNMLEKDLQEVQASTQTYLLKASSAKAEELRNEVSVGDDSYKLLPIEPIPLDEVDAIWPLHGLASQNCMGLETLMGQQFVGTFRGWSKHHDWGFLTARDHFDGSLFVDGSQCSARAGILAGSLVNFVIGTDDLGRVSAVCVAPAADPSKCPSWTPTVNVPGSPCSQLCSSPAAASSCTSASPTASKQMGTWPAGLPSTPLTPVHRTPLRRTSFPNLGVASPVSPSMRMTRATSVPLPHQVASPFAGSPALPMYFQAKALDAAIPDASQVELAWKRLRTQVCQFLISLAVSDKGILVNKFTKAFKERFGWLPHPSIFNKSRIAHVFEEMPDIVRIYCGEMHTWLFPWGPARADGVPWQCAACFAVEPRQLLVASALDVHMTIDERKEIIQLGFCGHVFQDTNQATAVWTEIQKSEMEWPLTVIAQTDHEDVLRRLAIAKPGINMFIIRPGPAKCFEHHGYGVLWHVSSIGEAIDLITVSSQRAAALKAPRGEPIMPLPSVPPIRLPEEAMLQRHILEERIAAAFQPDDAESARSVVGAPPGLESEIGRYTPSVRSTPATTNASASTTPSGTPAVTPRGSSLRGEAEAWAAHVLDECDKRSVSASARCSASVPRSCLATGRVSRRGADSEPASEAETEVSHRSSVSFCMPPPGLEGELVDQDEFESCKDDATTDAGENPETYGSESEGPTTLASPESLSFKGAGRVRTVIFLPQQDGPVDGKGTESTVFVENVHFTREVTSTTFRDGRPLEDLIKALDDKRVDPLQADFLVLEVVKGRLSDGNFGLFSNNNRRLHCLKEHQKNSGQQVQIHVRVSSALGTTVHFADTPRSEEKDVSAPYVQSLRSTRAPTSASGTPRSRSQGKCRFSLPDREPDLSPSMMSCVSRGSSMSESRSVRFGDLKGLESRLRSCENDTRKLRFGKTESRDISPAPSTRTASADSRPEREGSVSSSDALSQEAIVLLRYAGAVGNGRMACSAVLQVVRPGRQTMLLFADSVCIDHPGSAYVATYGGLFLGLAMLRRHASILHEGHNVVAGGGNSDVVRELWGSVRASQQRRPQESRLCWEVRRGLRALAEACPAPPALTCLSPQQLARPTTIAERALLSGEGSIEVPGLAALCVEAVKSQEHVLRMSAPSFHPRQQLPQQPQQPLPRGLPAFSQVPSGPAAELTHSPAQQWPRPQMPQQPLPRGLPAFPQAPRGLAAEPLSPPAHQWPRGQPPAAVTQRSEQRSSPKTATAGRPRSVRRNSRQAAPAKAARPTEPKGVEPKKVGLVS